MKCCLIWEYDTISPFCLLHHNRFLNECLSFRNIIYQHLLRSLAPDSIRLNISHSFNHLGIKVVLMKETIWMFKSLKAYKLFTPLWFQGLNSRNDQSTAEKEEGGLLWAVVQKIRKTSLMTSWTDDTFWSSSASSSNSSIFWLLENVQIRVLW